MPIHTLIEMLRGYIEPIMAFNGVKATDGQPLFDGKHWRTFWYDVTTGVAAISAWDAHRLTNKNFLIAGRRESEANAEMQRFTLYQLPSALQLPLVERYVACRLPTMSMCDFKALYPDSLLMIEVEKWTELWCKKQRSRSTKHYK